MSADTCRFVNANREDANPDHIITIPVDKDATTWRQEIWRGLNSGKYKKEKIAQYKGKVLGVNHPVSLIPTAHRKLIQGVIEYAAG